MAFWCMFLMRVLMQDFGNFSFVSLSMDVYNSSYSCCDGNEGVGFPFIILYGVD